MAYDAAIALDEGNMTFRTNKVRVLLKVYAVQCYPSHHYHRRVYVSLTLAPSTPLIIPPQPHQAAVFMEQGHFDEAIAECEAAVAVGRQNRAKYEDVAKAFVRMAKACLKKDDLDAALTALRQAQVCGWVDLGLLGCV